MEVFADILMYVFFGLYIFTTLSTITVILLENRDPVKTISWLLVLLLVPLFGLMFYAMFGQNFRQRKIISKKSIRRLKYKSADALDMKAIDKNDFPESTYHLIKLLYFNNEAPLYEKNAVEIYTNGEETFDAIFEAIDKAEEHIHAEFFIIEPDPVGRKFRDLLIKKAKEGVRVRLIYDYWGSFNLNKKFFQPLREAGAYVHPFLPAKFPFFAHKINYRNHRKMVVIDGKVGFTGGLNVATRYREGDYLGKWRDTTIRIEGTAVYGLQNTFLMDWYFVDRKLITDKKYYPEHYPSRATNRIQIVHSGPDTDWENIMQGIFIAIAAAKKYVYIHTPYFMPTEVVAAALKVAALGGIDVRIIVPSKSDTSLARSSNYSFIGPMVEAGVRVYLYKNGFLHSKAIVIDDFISTVGTANMDFRSYEQNFEVNAFIYDKKTAVSLKKFFLNDLAKCTEVTRQEWAARSKWERLKESFARLFSPLM